MRHETALWSRLHRASRSLSAGRCETSVLREAPGERSRTRHAARSRLKRSRSEARPGRGQSGAGKPTPVRRARAAPLSPRHEDAVGATPAHSRGHVSCPLSGAG